MFFAGSLSLESCLYYIKRTNHHSGQKARCSAGNRHELIRGEPGEEIGVDRAETVDFMGDFEVRVT